MKERKEEGMEELAVGKNCAGESIPYWWSHSKTMQPFTLLRKILLLCHAGPIASIFCSFLHMLSSPVSHSPQTQHNTHLI